MEFYHAVARIAVWNLAQFYPSSDEKFLNQVKGLAILDAEVVILVEVKPMSYIDRLAEGLSDMGIAYHTAILQQPYHDMNIGILYKQGVQVDNLRLLDGSEYVEIDDSGVAKKKGRQALTADIRIAEFSAHLVGVHLKSGRSAPSQRLRDAQCKAIGSYISAYKAAPGQSDDTVLLMGDFNMVPGQDVSNFHHLGGEDVMDFLSCWDLQDRFSHILPGGPANLLDGYAISRTPIKRRAYIRGSLRLFPMHWTMDMGRAKFRDEVSDHLPFTASFRIYGL